MCWPQCTLCRHHHKINWCDKIYMQETVYTSLVWKYNYKVHFRIAHMVLMCLSISRTNCGILKPCINILSIHFNCADDSLKEACHCNEDAILTQIQHDIRTTLPLEATLTSENIVFPSLGEVWLFPSLGEVWLSDFSSL